VNNIEGLHVRLRDIRHDDVEAYCHWQQPGRAWQDLDGPYYPKATPEEIEQTVDHGMIRLAQKLGYRQEDRFRKARIVKGAYCDGLGYGILREDWQTQFPAEFAVR
jgi:RimJ/RimL family protein N-acetyltransferase